MWYVLQYDTLGGSLTPIDTGRFTSSTYAFAAHTAEQLVNVGTAPTTGQTLAWNGTSWSPGVNPWNDYMIAEDQEGDVDGGTNVFQGWQKRTLNTVVSSAGSAISLNATSYCIKLNQAGTYYIRASAPAGNVGSHILEIQDSTTSATYIRGTSAYANSASMNTVSEAEGIITVSASPITIFLNHYTDNVVTTYGLGYRIGTLGTSGALNVYSKIFVQKVN
jgi:hypothetical protein